MATIITGRMSAEQMKMLKDRVTRLARQAAGRDGFIEYSRAMSFTAELEDILEREAEPLITRNLVMQSFELTCHVFLTAGRYPMDDSDGGLSSLAGYCATLWEAQADIATPKQREKMYDWFEKTHQKGIPDFFEETLWETQKSVFSDEALLHRSLAHADELIAEAGHCTDTYGEYKLSHTVLDRLALMERMGCAEVEIRAFREKYQYLSDVRQEMIRAHLAGGEYEKVVALLQKSKRRDKDMPWLVAQYSRELIEIYNDQAAAAALREELLFQIFQCRQGDLRYIHMLKEHTAPDEWEPLREKILRADTTCGVHLRFLESEGLYHRLLEEIFRTENRRAMDEFENTLKDRFPDEVRDFYLERLDIEMQRASDRKNYWVLIQYLKKVAKYPGGRELAQKLADRWRQDYPRRSSLMDELKKAGF